MDNKVQVEVKEPAATSIVTEFTWLPTQLPSPATAAAFTLALRSSSVAIVDPATSWVQELQRQRYAGLVFCRVSLDSPRPVRLSLILSDGSGVLATDLEQARFREQLARLREWRTTLPASTPIYLALPPGQCVSNWQLPALRLVDGVFCTNLALDRRTGTFQFPHDDEMLRTLRWYRRERPNFPVLVLEAIDRPHELQPTVAAQWHKWCGDNQLVGRIQGSQTHSPLSLAAMLPLDFLRHIVIQQFASPNKSVPMVPASMDMPIGDRSNDQAALSVRRWLLQGSSGASASVKHWYRQLSVDWKRVPHAPTLQEAYRQGCSIQAMAELEEALSTLYFSPVHDGDAAEEEIKHSSSDTMTSLRLLPLYQLSPSPPLGRRSRRLAPPLPSALVEASSSRSNSSHANRRDFLISRHHVQQRPLAPHVVDWSETRRITHNLTTLREDGDLDELSALREVEVFAGDPATNAKLKTVAPALKQALQQLRALDPSRVVQLLTSGAGLSAIDAQQRAESHLARIAAFCDAVETQQSGGDSQGQDGSQGQGQDGSQGQGQGQDGNVSVWLCDPMNMLDYKSQLPPATISLRRPVRAWAVAESEHGTKRRNQGGRREAMLDLGADAQEHTLNAFASHLHVYVSRNHPCIAEALLYCAITTSSEVQPIEAVLLEAALRSGRGLSLLSQRIEEELANMAYFDLSVLVLRTGMYPSPLASPVLGIGQSRNLPSSASASAPTSLDDEVKRPSDRPVVTRRTMPRYIQHCLATAVHGAAQAALLNAAPPPNLTPESLSQAFGPVHLLPSIVNVACARCRAKDPTDHVRDHPSVVAAVPAQLPRPIASSPPGRSRRPYGFSPRAIEMKGNHSDDADASEVNRHRCCPFDDLVRAARRLEWCFTQAMMDQSARTMLFWLLEQTTWRQLHMPHLANPCDALLRDVCLRTSRVHAVEDLTARLLATLPQQQITRQRDVCAVFAEFNGISDEAAAALFAMTKHELAATVYVTARHHMAVATTTTGSVGASGSSAVATVDSREAVRVKQSVKAKSSEGAASTFADGLFFILPIPLNNILAMTTGTGLFLSSLLPGDQQQILSLAIFLGLLASAGWSLMLGRLGGMLTNKWSHSLLLLAVTRYMMASVLFYVVSGALAALALIAFVGATNAGLFWAMYMAFSIGLTLTAALYSSRTGPVSRSWEGWAVASGLLFLAGLVMVIHFVLAYDTAHNANTLRARIYLRYGAAAHVLAAMLWCVWYAVALAWSQKRRLVTKQMSKPMPMQSSELIALVRLMQAEHLHTARGAAVAAGALLPLPATDASYNKSVQLYHQSLTDWMHANGHVQWALPLTGAQVSEAEQAVRVELVRQRRSIIRGLQAKHQHRQLKAAARDATLELGPMARGVAFDKYAAKRLKSHDNEADLLQWYCLANDLDYASLVQDSGVGDGPFSEEWDRLLVKAQESMSIKQRTDTEMRNGLVWTMAGRSLFPFGTLYFFILLLDRPLAYLFFPTAHANSMGLWVPSSIQESASSWSLIALLITTCTLEAALVRLYRFLHHRQQQPLTKPLPPPRSSSHAQQLEHNESQLQRNADRTQTLVRRFFFVELGKLSGVFVLAGLISGLLLVLSVFFLVPLAAHLPLVLKMDDMLRILWYSHPSLAVSYGIELLADGGFAAAALVRLFVLELPSSSDSVASTSFDMVAAIIVALLTGTVMRVFGAGEVFVPMLRAAATWSYFLFALARLLRSWQREAGSIANSYMLQALWGPRFLTSGLRSLGPRTAVSTHERLEMSLRAVTAVREGQAVQLKPTDGPGSLARAVMDCLEAAISVLQQPPLQHGQPGAARLEAGQQWMSTPGSAYLHLRQALVRTLRKEGLPSGEHGNAAPSADTPSHILQDGIVSPRIMVKQAKGTGWSLAAAPATASAAGHGPGSAAGIGMSESQLQPRASACTAGSWLLQQVLQLFASGQIAVYAVSESDFSPSSSTSSSSSLTSSSSSTSSSGLLGGYMAFSFSRHQLANSLQDAVDNHSMYVGEQMPEYVQATLRTLARLPKAQLHIFLACGHATSVQVADRAVECLVHEITEACIIRQPPVPIAQPAAPGQVAIELKPLGHRRAVLAEVLYRSAMIGTNHQQDDGNLIDLLTDPALRRRLVPQRMQHQISRSTDDELLRIWLCTPEETCSQNMPAHGGDRFDDLWPTFSLEERRRWLADWSTCSLSVRGFANQIALPSQGMSKGAIGTWLALTVGDMARLELQSRRRNAVAPAPASAALAQSQRAPAPDEALKLPFVWISKSPAADLVEHTRVRHTLHPGWNWINPLWSLLWWLDTAARLLWQCSIACPEFVTEVEATISNPKRSGFSRALLRVLLALPRWCYPLWRQLVDWCLIARIRVTNRAFDTYMLRVRKGIIRRQFDHGGTRPQLGAGGVAGPAAGVQTTLVHVMDPLAPESAIREHHSLTAEVYSETQSSVQDTIRQGKLLALLDYHPQTKRLLRRRDTNGTNNNIITWTSFYVYASDMHTDKTMWDLLHLIRYALDLRLAIDQHGRNNAVLPVCKLVFKGDVPLELKNHDIVQTLLILHQAPDLIVGYDKAGRHCSIVHLQVAKHPGAVLAGQFEYDADVHAALCMPSRAVYVQQPHLPMLPAPRPVAVAGAQPAGAGAGASVRPPEPSIALRGQVEVFWHPMTSSVAAVRSSVPASANRICTSVADHTNSGQVRWCSIEHDTAQPPPADLGLWQAIIPDLIKRGDPLQLLKPPIRMSSFYVEDPFLSLPSVTLNTYKRRLTSACCRRSQYGVQALPTFTDSCINALPTNWARQLLWAMWAESLIVGAVAQLADTYLLRQDEFLATYWTRRDRGQLAAVGQWVREHASQLTTMLHFKMNRSQLCARVTDLEECLPPGFSRRMCTRGIEDQARRDKSLIVLACDSGSWPCEVGGVSAARRDLVDNMYDVRWRVESEIGAPTRIPRFQFEERVDEMRLIPLWGTELGGLSEIVEMDVPFEVHDERQRRTTDHVIRTYFVPLLLSVCRAIKQQLSASGRQLTIAECEALSTTFLSIHHYFRQYDWVITWSSRFTLHSWRAALGYQLRQPTGHSRHAARARASDRSSWLAIEHPDTEALDIALLLLTHFMIPLAVRDDTQAECIQSSHHGSQSLRGLILKRLHGIGFLIWDHGMLWRERCIGLAKEPLLPLFARNVLTAYARIAAALAMYNADTVVSCTSVSNPGWERELGGTLDPRHGRSARMALKLSPVINGMRQAAFTVNRNKEISSTPTAVMLSHLNPLKDVKSAILAAQIIARRYQLPYRLLCYGSKTQDEEYADECVRMVDSLALSDVIELPGLGNSSAVLPQGWVFVNSSRSEGLPLALGEAALCGLTVCCTDVGGSRQVITFDGKVYGAVVPPADADALAIGQIKTMALLDDLATEQERKEGQTWDRYRAMYEAGGEAAARARDELAQRMTAVKARRQMLGMELRTHIITEFGFERYITQHKLSFVQAARLRGQRLVR